MNTGNEKVCKVCLQVHPMRIGCSVWVEMRKRAESDKQEKVPRETPVKLTLSEQKKAWWAERKAKWAATGE